MTIKSHPLKPLSPTPSTPLFAKRHTLPAAALTATALVITGCSETHTVTYDAGVSDGGPTTYDAGLYGPYDAGVFDTGVDLGVEDADVQVFDGGISPLPDAG